MLTQYAKFIKTDIVEMFLKLEDEKIQKWKPLNIFGLLLNAILIDADIIELQNRRRTNQMGERLQNRLQKIEANY